MSLENFCKQTFTGGPFWIIFQRKIKCKIALNEK